MQSVNRILPRKTAQVQTRRTPRVRCDAEQISFADAHVKETEPRKRVRLQQSAREELLPHLAELHSAHLRAERREFGVRLLTECDQLCFAGVRAQGIDHSLFKNGVG